MGRNQGSKLRQRNGMWRNGFIAIPTEVYTNHFKGMSRSEIMVYIELSHHADNDDVAWPSIQHIAEDTGLSRIQVIRAINSLKEKGLLAVKREIGRANTYKIAKVTPQKPVSPTTPVSSMIRVSSEQTSITGDTPPVSSMIPTSNISCITEPQKEPEKPCDTTPSELTAGPNYPYRTRPGELSNSEGGSTPLATPPVSSPLAEKEEKDKSVQLGEKEGGKDEPSTVKPKTHVELLQERTAQRLRPRSPEELNYVETDPAKIRARLLALGITDEALIEQMVRVQLELARKRTVVIEREGAFSVAEVLSVGLAEGGDGDGA
jgi:biotin operon repressor